METLLQGIPLRGMLLQPCSDFGGRWRGTGNALANPIFSGNTTTTPAFTPLLAPTSGDFLLPAWGCRELSCKGSVEPWKDPESQGNRVSSQRAGVHGVCVWESS